MSTPILKITFLINGVSSLLGWNAILSSFDFYNSKFSSYNVYLWFPIPLFLMYVTVGLTLHLIHKAFSYRVLIMSGLVMTNFIQVLLPLTAYYLHDTSTGFVLCLLLSGASGFASNITQLSCYALINFMSFDIVSLYNQGMAVSGLVMISIRMIILGARGAADSNNFSSIVIYMILTILVNTIDIFLNIKFFASDYYKDEVQPQEQNRLVEQAGTQNSNQKIVQDGYYRNLYNAHNQISPYDIFIFLNYIQTFTLFPSISYRMVFSMNGVWALALLNFFYNLGDFAGRIFCNYRKLFNKQSLVYLFFARFVFFWTMIALAKGINDPLLNNDAFAFVNIFLFSLTNGIVTNGNFCIIFEVVKKYKSYAGVLSGMLLQMGIFAGSLLAIPLAKI